MRRLHAAEAFLFAVGAIGTALFILGVAGVPLRLPVMIFVSVAVLLLLARRFERARYPWAATVLMLVPFIPVALDVLLLPSRDWDGLITWLPKARAIAVEGSIYGSFFRGEGGLNLHNHYPLLLPLDAAVLLRFFGPASVRWLYALVALSLVLMLRHRLVAIADERAAAWIAAIAAWIPLVTTGYGSAVSAYADLAVAAFSGAALLAIVRDREPAPWLAFLVLTKNEGVMLVAALVVTAVIMRRLRAWTVIAPAAATALLAIWRSIVPDAYDERYSVLLRELPQRLDRLDDAALALLQYMGTWGLLWPAALLALIAALISSRHRRVAAATGIYVALALAGYTLIFTVTSWNIDELARVAAERLLLHVLVPLFLLLALGWRALADLRPPRPAPPRTA